MFRDVSFSFLLFRLFFWGEGGGVSTFLAFYAWVWQHNSVKSEMMNSVLLLAPLFRDGDESEGGGGGG